MAEYYTTVHIAHDVREQIKKDSRRIRLGGVRARAVIFSIDAPPVLSCLKAFSWADITTVIRKLRGNTESMKSEILTACADKSMHGVIVTDPKGSCSRINELYDLIPCEKDILCCGAQSLSAVISDDSSAYVPCPADAVIRMLDYADFTPDGKNITLAGKGSEMRTLAYILAGRGANVLLSHDLNASLIPFCKSSELIISAIGRENVLDKKYIRDYQIIFDMGYRISGRGDVDISSVEPYVHALFLNDEPYFTELCDYIAAEHVIRSAERQLRAADLIEDRK